MAKRQGLEKVYVHCFLDGRDTPPQSAKEFTEELENEIKKINAAGCIIYRDCIICIFTDGYNISCRGIYCRKRDGDRI